jgi:hypothetical protein
MNRTEKHIALYINKCIGLRVSDAWRGERTAIFLELGKLHKHSGKRHHFSKGKGDVTLMFDCKWRLESKGSIVVGSLDSYKRIENQIKKLIGTPIKSISFVGRLPEIVIEFEEQRWLQSFTSYKSEDWGIIFRNNCSIGRKNKKVVYDNR